MATSILLRRRLFSLNPKPFHFLSLKLLSSLSSTPSTSGPTPSEPSSLSARMRFVFDQIDAIEKEHAEKDQTLQRIRAWRESKKSATLSQSQLQPQSQTQSEVSDADSVPDKSKEMDSEKERCSVVGHGGGLMDKEVELVHPWPEWIELMERLVQQNYFDHKRKDEDKMIEDLGFSVSDAVEHEGFDFTRDWKTVQTAVLNFGRDRFDILRALSRHDLQIFVGYGCPSADKRVVFSAKLLRKHVHLDEGDVCSSCNLRSSCEKAYLLTNKEDEARTIDVMRVLLTFAFDPVNGSVANKSLLKMKSVKSVIRKLLHEVVKLSAVPIDPNLPPPIIKKPPPKVKQPPPPPKKRVGRDDIEMKKGDWLCPKCDFMNFAKNTVCLQCDAKRPKRQLLPGEWECPQCNFLNYRRNVVCFHCEFKRPPDDYTESQLKERQRGPRMSLDNKMPARVARQDVSNAWNFNFDDDESDGADVAAFEYADSKKLDIDFPLDKQVEVISRPPKGYETDFSGPQKRGLVFNDFDDEEDDIDSYEVDTRNEIQKNSQINYSELEVNSESEDMDDDNLLSRRHNSLTDRKSKSMRESVTLPGSEDSEIDFDSDNEHPIRSNRKYTSKPRTTTRHSSSFESDDDAGLSSGSEIDEDFRSRQRKGNKFIRDFGRRGSSKNKGEHFSDLETDDDDLNYHTSRQRGIGTGRNGRLNPTNRSDKIARKSNSFVDDSNRRTRDFHRNGKGIKDNRDSYRTDSTYGESWNRSGRGSYNRGQGSNNYGNRPDSYLDDERYRRPRINVR
nr:zinc finger protein var3, chloroplastic [Ipomoea batatas]